MDSTRADLWTFDVQQIIQQLNIRQLSQVINQSLFNWVDPCDLRGFWLQQLEPARPQIWDNTDDKEVAAQSAQYLPKVSSSSNVRTQGCSLTCNYSKHTLITCGFLLRTAILAVRPNGPTYHSHISHPRLMLRAELCGLLPLVTGQSRKIQHDFKP